MKTAVLLIVTTFSNAQQSEWTGAAFPSTEACERTGQSVVSSSLAELSRKGVKVGSVWFRCTGVKGRAIGDWTE